MSIPRLRLDDSQLASRAQDDAQALHNALALSQVEIDLGPPTDVADLELRLVHPMPGAHTLRWDVEKRARRRRAWLARQVSGYAILLEDGVETGVVLSYDKTLIGRRAPLEEMRVFEDPVLGAALRGLTAADSVVGIEPPPHGCKCNFYAQ